MITIALHTNAKLRRIRVEVQNRIRETAEQLGVFPAGN